MAPKSDDEKRQSEEYWHARLMEAQKRYQENRTPETRSAYLRELRAFADAVVLGVPPNRSSDRPLDATRHYGKDQ